VGTCSSQTYKHDPSSPRVITKCDFCGKIVFRNPSASRHRGSGGPCRAGGSVRDPQPSVETSIEGEHESHRSPLKTRFTVRTSLVGTRARDFLTGGGEGREGNGVLFRQSPKPQAVHVSADARRDRSSARTRQRSPSRSVPFCRRRVHGPTGS